MSQCNEIREEQTYPSLSISLSVSSSWLSASFLNIQLKLQANNKWYVKHLKQQSSCLEAIAPLLKTLFSGLIDPNDKWWETVLWDGWELMNKKADKNVKQLNLKDSPEYNITYSIIIGDNASNSSDWADGECLESLAFEVSKLKTR